jgi:hypothetical protein
MEINWARSLPCVTTLIKRVRDFSDPRKIEIRPVPVLISFRKKPYVKITTSMNQIDERAPSESGSSQTYRKTEVLKY